MLRPLDGLSRTKDPECPDYEFRLALGRLPQTHDNKPVFKQRIEKQLVSNFVAGKKWTYDQLAPPWLPPICIRPEVPEQGETGVGFDCLDLRNPLDSHPTT